jgi:hypothetical protein
LSKYIPPFASIAWFQKIYENPSIKIPMKFNILFSYPIMRRAFCLINKYDNNITKIPKKDENRLTLKAGEPTGKRENILPVSVNSGYEGGCPMPSVYALVMVSGESLFLKAG